MIDHKILNPNKRKNNNKYLLFHDVPPTYFGPYKPSSKITFTKEYTENKQRPSCVYMRLNYKVINYNAAASVQNVD